MWHIFLENPEYLCPTRFITVPFKPFFSPCNNVENNIVFYNFISLTVFSVVFAAEIHKLEKIFPYSWSNIKGTIMNHITLYVEVTEITSTVPLNPNFLFFNTGFSSRQPPLINPWFTCSRVNLFYLVSLLLLNPLPRR